MNNQQLPALFQSADQLSNEWQRLFLWGLRLNLVFLVVAAGLSLWNPSNSLGAIGQVVALLLGLGCTVLLAVKHPEQVWYGARAVAESVKTSAWRFMMKGEPYNDMSQEDAHAKFRDTLHLILEQNRDTARLLPVTPDKSHVTLEMIDIFRKPWGERREIYQKERIINQLEWYARKSRFNKIRSRIFFGILIFCNAVALLSAVCKVAFPHFEYWPTDFFGSCAAAVLAWIQAKRFGELAASYNLAAHEIALIREKVASIKQEKEFVLFVGDAENAFSREHTQWAARKDM